MNCSLFREEVYSWKKKTLSETSKYRSREKTNSPLIFLNLGPKRLAYDVTSSLRVGRKKGGVILNQRFYSTSHFAALAGVTVRTLRYYDREGLLVPTAHTEAGHRQYSDADLARLQQILALKYLGFSLDEIRRCLRVGPRSLRESLALQRAMLEEQRVHLEKILQVFDYAEIALRERGEDWETIVELIRMFTMSHDFSRKYYTEEQRQKLAEWGKNWTVEDQRVATQRWEAVLSELRRLVAANEDPAGPAAQALAREWNDLITGFTHGDAGVEQGLGNMYSDIAKMPAEQRPYPMPFDEAGGAFIMQAVKLYRESINK
ncbi:MAG TPA: MerR family transcriptional regulator, partial [Ktedonobacteraceae bacterium]